MSGNQYGGLLSPPAWAVSFMWSSSGGAKAPSLRYTVYRVIARRPSEQEGRRGDLSTK